MSNGSPKVELHDGHLRVHFAGGSPRWADFHYRWLRHQCDGDRHPTTRERTVDAAEIPANVRPAWARIEGERELVVEWVAPSGPEASEARRSTYALDWLAAHAYAADREAAPAPPSDLAPVTLDAAELSADETARIALDRVDEGGVIVVRRFLAGTPPEKATSELIAAFEKLALRVRATHFGAIEDLRTDNTTNQNTDQLGYTDAPVDLHTDQPFLDDPPRYQLLQCIRAASAGGENQVVDALAAARYLRSLDAPAEETLRTTSVRFHRKQRAFEAIVDSPLLTGEGPSFRVRSSYFTLAPHRIAFERMEAFYAAYTRFTELVRDPRHQYRFLLAPGDFVLYDNARMLHGRSGFSGNRWLRGVYFDRAPVR